MTEEDALASALSLAEYTDEKLARLWLINIIPAAIAGPKSALGRLQIQVKEEMQRRSAKANGSLH